MNYMDSLQRIYQETINKCAKVILINNAVNSVGVLKELDDKFNSIDTKYLITNANVKQGDLITTLGHTYIVITADTPVNNIYNKVVVRKLPYTIKISLDGVSNKEFSCFADSKAFDINTGTYFSSVDGEIYVTLQNNLDTNSIKLGQRFIKFGYPWEITGINRTKEGLIILTVKVGSKLDTDDMKHESTIILHDYSMSIANKIDSINVNDVYNLILDCKVDRDVDSTPIITYTTSNPLIATIDNTGKITGVSDGNCSISATYHGITDTINLTVKTVHSIDITNKISSIKVGTNYSLVANCKTNGIEDTAPIVTYSSSDNSIATIDSNGHITGIGEGNVIITATYFDKSVTMELSIQAIAYAISITNKVSNLNVGGTLQLATTCTQDEVTDSSPIVIYSSSDNSILSVDSNGLVSAISTGTAAITVTYHNSTDTMSVTVAQADNFTYDLTPTASMGWIIKKSSTNTFTGHKYNNGVEVSGVLFDFIIDYGTLATSAITITATTDQYIKIKNNVDSGNFVLRCTERGTTNYVEKTVQLKNIYGN